MAFDADHDARVRSSAFAWLGAQVARHGDVLLRTLLAEGFQYKGTRVPLVGPQGIFKPKVLEEVPLTITTTPDSPYDDSFDRGGLLRYRFRGKDKNHPDNRGLRLAMSRRLPLAYFHGMVASKYVATWPVFIVDEDERALTFLVAVDDAEHSGLFTSSTHQLATGDEHQEIRRAYRTAAVRVRLHQRRFRERVIEAYRRQCAFCKLRHDAEGAVP